MTPRESEFIQYVQAKLAEDRASGEMDVTLGAEIVEKVPEAGSEM